MSVVRARYDDKHGRVKETQLHSLESAEQCSARALHIFRQSSRNEVKGCFRKHARDASRPPHRITGGIPWRIPARITASSKVGFTLSSRSRSLAPVARAPRVSRASVRSRARFGMHALLRRPSKIRPYPLGPCAISPSPCHAASVRYGYLLALCHAAFHSATRCHTVVCCVMYRYLEKTSP